MVHIGPAGGGTPIGIILQQGDIEPVEAAGGPDVKRVFLDLLDGADAGERQQKAKMIRGTRRSQMDALPGL